MMGRHRLHRDPPVTQQNRREFLKLGSAAAAAMATAQAPAIASSLIARRNRLRVAVVGTGGRGTGACRDHLVASPDVELVAMGNTDRERALSKLNALKGIAKIKDRVLATEDDVYGGLDCIDQVLARDDVDTVLLTTPPGFRPYHVQKAVAAKKHVFAEKPVCVDPAGYRICLEAHRQAEAQNTAIVTGTQYRRQTSYVEAIDRIHNGLIGDVISMTARYCSSPIWYRARQPGMSDAEYQIRNWMHFIWLSGDQIAEQAVHNIDVMNWIMDANPVQCYASGGRFFRPEDSEMWDTMSVDYEFPGGRMASVTARQLPSTDGDSDNMLYGSEGTAKVYAFDRGAKIWDKNGKEIWSTKGSLSAAYVQEHKELIESIQKGEPIVELQQTADSSLTAVMGRMSAYTGRRVSFEFAQQSKLDLFPKDLTMQSSIESPGYARPGETKLI